MTVGFCLMAWSICFSMRPAVALWTSRQNLMPFSVRQGSSFSTNGVSAWLYEMNKWRDLNGLIGTKIEYFVDYIVYFLVA